MKTDALFLMPENRDLRQYDTEKERREGVGSGKISAPFIDGKKVYEQTYNGGSVPDAVASPVGKDTDDRVPDQAVG